MIRPILRRGLRVYRNSALKWRYVDNLWPSLQYRLGAPALSGEAARVLDALNEKGIAVTSVQALLGQNASFEGLRQEVERLEAAQADDLAAKRKVAGQVADDKTYVYWLLGNRPVLDLEDSFVRFALQRPIIGIANAYFGMYTQLRFYNVWHHFAMEAPPQRSQLWHRDREDRLILKMFVYLADVDEGAGPFTYAPGTHAKGPIRVEPESFLEPNRKNPRSTDEQMSAVVPPEQWVKAIGPAGTIVFADTNGYHKGGLARTRDRLLYTCMFVSSAAKCKVFYQRPERLRVPTDKAQAFALSA